MLPPVDRRLIQRFEVRERIADNGMGTLYRVYDPSLQREVAIKVLKTGADASRLGLISMGDTIDLRDRATKAATGEDLLHDARVMAQLSHPNAVPIYEVGCEGTAVFVVMDYVRGQDLRRWIDNRTRTRKPAELYALFAQAGRALAGAHDRGVVHRDFRPENVIIGLDGRARLTDFGLPPITNPLGLVETTRITAPELRLGGRATHASDTFAFAMSLGGALVRDANLDRDELTAALLKRNRDRGARRLHKLVAAGLATDPAMRPSIERICDALEGKRRRTGGTWVIVLTAAILIGIGIGAFLTLR